MKSFIYINTLIILAITLVATAGCQNLKIPGNIAGQLLDTNGFPQGLVSCQLIDATSGAVVQQETANDQGSYFFKRVDPGTYKIKTLGIGGGEIPNDCDDFVLSPGKTVTKDIILYRDGKPADDAG